MPSEKDVKDAARKRSSGSREAICSRTGRPCECESGGGCQTVGGGLDPVSAETLRLIKTARIYLEAAKNTLDDINPEWERVRRYPAPELREVRRKVVTGIAMIDEIGGDL